MTAPNWTKSGSHLLKHQFTGRHLFVLWPIVIHLYVSEKHIVPAHSLLCLVVKIVATGLKWMKIIVRSVIYVSIMNYTTSPVQQSLECHGSILLHIEFHL